MNKTDDAKGMAGDGANAILTYSELRERLIELDAVIQALREHQVDAIVGESDVALVHLRQVEEALRESNERYRAFVANSSEGIWCYEIDPPLPIDLSEDEQIDHLLTHGRVAECNDAMAQLYGYEAASDLIEASRANEGPVLAQPETLRALIRSGYRLQRLDAQSVDHLGATHYLSVSFAGAARDGLLTRLWGVQRDITERHQREDALHKRTDEITAILAASRDLAGTLEQQSLLAKILAHLRTVVAYSGGYIALIEGRDLQLIGYDGPLPRDLIQRKLPGLAVGTPFRSLLDERRAAILDLPAFVSLAPDGDWPALAADFPYPAQPSQSWLLAPLVVRDELIGVLALEHPEADHFTDGHARLVEAFADHCAVAIQNTRLFEKAQQLAAVNERQRLAGELHDSVSQSLYGISLGAHTVLSILESEPHRVPEVLNHVLDLAEAAFSEMRTLIFELRPEALQRQGLVTALARQADILRNRHKLNVHVALGAEPQAPAETKEILYRIAQESLNNIAKHAEATEVWLKLVREGDTLCLTVHDNGRGFDPGIDYAGHLGLKVMRERAERRHGQLEITSAPDQGTTVRLCVPAGS